MAAADVHAAALPSARPSTTPGAAAARRRGVLVVLALWAASRLALAVLALDGDLYPPSVQGDVRLYGARVERTLQGEVPYREVAMEYPPASVAFTLLPALALGGTGPLYRAGFVVEMLLVDALGLLAAARLARRVDAGRPRAMLAYVLALAMLGPIVLLRFDLVPAVCSLWALALVIEGRAGLAAALLGLGTATKLYPAVLVPLLVLGLVPAWGWWRALARVLPPFAAGLALTTVPALLLSVQGTVASVTYHIHRGVQIESLWANAIELAHTLGVLPARVVYGSGSFEIASSASEEARTLSSALTAACLLVTAALVWRAAAARGLSPPGWAAAITLGVLAFMLPARVLSPQYLIWLAPLVGMVPWRRGRRGALLLSLASLLTHVIFPLRYDQLRQLEALDVGLLTLRNLLLVALAALVARALYQEGRARGGAARAYG